MPSLSYAVHASLSSIASRRASEICDCTDNRASSPLLNCAIDHVKDQHPRNAVDLGYGAGNETWQLIKAGWHVLAIDKEPEAVARTITKC